MLYLWLYLQHDVRVLEDLYAIYFCPQENPLPFEICFGNLPHTIKLHNIFISSSSFQLTGARVGLLWTKPTWALFFKIIQFSIQHHMFKNDWFYALFFSKSLDTSMLNSITSYTKQYYQVQHKTSGYQVSS